MNGAKFQCCLGLLRQKICFACLLCNNETTHDGDGPPLPGFATPRDHLHYFYFNQNVGQPSCVQRVVTQNGFHDNSSTDISSTTLRLQTFRLQTFRLLLYTSV